MSTIIEILTAAALMFAKKKPVQYSAEFSALL